MKSLRKSKLTPFYIMLSITFLIVIILNFILEKAHKDISLKRNFIEEKEREVKEIKKILNSVDLNYTPRNLVSVKSDIYTLIDRLSKRFSVNVKDDFLVNGKIIALHIEISKNNLSQEDLRLFFDTLSYPSLFVKVERLYVEKKETESKLEAYIEIKQIFQ